MKKLFIAVLCLTIITSFPGQSKAQVKTVSLEDKVAIAQIFKTVDPKLFRLEYMNGTQKIVFGTKTVSMQELEQVKIERSTTSTSTTGKLIPYLSDLIVFTINNNNVVSVLGQEKADRVNAILAKYQ